MAYEKDLKDEIAQVESLKVLTDIYGEIASIRMKKTRNFVLKNREFLQSINSIFKDALAVYASRLSRLVRAGKIKKGGRVTFLAHNGKTVAVFISANTGFYGEIVQRTFKRLIKDIKDQEDVEITVIGRLGRLLFLEKMPQRPHTYFDLPDYGIDQEKLSEIIKHLVAYEEIRLYYGKYQSVVTQKPTMNLISAGTMVSENVARPEVEFIFEPTVEKILMFFETEIFASLFDQSVRESQLSKFASRILAMDRASVTIKERIDYLNLEELKLSHRISDRKQLNSLSSVMFSGKFSS